MIKKNIGISVIGLGKLGLCVGAVFAEKGFNVIGVDVDISKIEKINMGISPIEETGLAELVKKVKNNLEATRDHSRAVLGSDITFIVVATPSLADGSFSNKYLEESLHKIAEVLRNKDKYHLVVITSTVMPQTTEKVAKFILEKVSGKKCGEGFGLAYNPEFIALGSVIHDFKNPDFILIGEMNKKDGDLLEKIYGEACDNTPRFARMSAVNAEIAKISLNCYVTTKITFANSLAAICENINGADAHIITKSIGMDTRIGAKYLRPGLGFGGPCFPRDNFAFVAFARKAGVKANLAEAVVNVNDEQVERIVNLAKSQLDKGEKAAILGLSYKSNTPIIEDSQAISIVELLVRDGYKVSVYDPMSMENAKSILGDKVDYASGMVECIKGSSLCIIATPWVEFKALDSLILKKNMKKAVVLDCWDLVEGNNLEGIKYIVLGKGNI